MAFTFTLIKHAPAVKQFRQFLKNNKSKMWFMSTHLTVPLGHIHQEIFFISGFNTKDPRRMKNKKKTMKIYKKMKSQQKNWFKRIQKLWSGILLVLLVDKKHFYTTIKTFLFTIVDQFEFDTAAPHHEKVKAQTEKHTPASQSAEASMLQCGTVCGFKRKACCFRLKSSERTTLCE